MRLSGRFVIAALLTPFNELYLPIELQDLDGRELNFLTDNRPAKRFMYFRFVVSYIFAQQKGNECFLNKVENRKELWPSPGEYLRKSTLISLARNISGLELPPAILDNNTFEEPNSLLSETEAENSAILLSAQLRRACIASARD
jgi:hypothetical protein